MVAHTRTYPSHKPTRAPVHFLVSFFQTLCCTCLMLSLAYIFGSLHTSAHICTNLYIPSIFVTCALPYIDLHDLQELESAGKACWAKRRQTGREDIGRAPLSDLPYGCAPRQRGRGDNWEPGGAKRPTVTTFGETPRPSEIVPGIFLNTPLFDH